MTIYTIKATILLEKSLWVGIFERTDKKNYAVARIIFGKEPTDPELYNFILTHYDELNFSAPQDFNLIIKRMNPKRLKRAVRKEVEKTKKTQKKTSHAQEVLRTELERNKKIRKSVSKAEKEQAEKRKFQLRQQKKKRKQQGH